jgi:hypothetical protein
LKRETTTGENPYACSYAFPSWDEYEGLFVESYFLTPPRLALDAAPRRIKLFRLAFDAAVSSFSGRQQLYERYYSGDPMRLAGTLYNIYDKQPFVDRVTDLLADLEARYVHR